MDNFICINQDMLASKLADFEFKVLYEDKLPFDTVFEQVDETENFYMRNEYYSIWENIRNKWIEELDTLEIVNTL